MVRRLVEQKQVGLGGERGGEQDAAAEAAGEAVERRIGRNAELGHEARGGGRGQAVFARRAVRDDVRRGSGHVGRHVLREIFDLQAGLADDVAGVGGDEAREDLEEGGLAFAVASGDAGAFARLDGEVDGIEDGGAAEADGDVAECDQSHGRRDYQIPPPLGDPGLSRASQRP